jgi:HSP20 family molecular chaperone IbpA
MATQEIEKRKPSDVVQAQTEKKTYFQPATDVCETDNHIVIQFDMPGVSRDNVDLTVEKGTLIVTGQADPEEKGTAVYRETHIGDYQRTFTLSDDVDMENITAEMKAGVLTVRVAKAEKAKPKRVEIACA